MGYKIDGMQQNQEIAIAQLESLIHEARAGMVEIYEIDCRYGYRPGVIDEYGNVVEPLSPDGTARYTISTRRISGHA